MLRISTFSCIFIVCNFMYNSQPVCVLISSVGCYRFLLSGLQVLQMALVVTPATWIQPHGLFTHPQENQFPLEVLAQVLLLIMWLDTGLSLSFYGISCHMASPNWKLDLTLNQWFPSSIEIFRCETLFYYIGFCKLGYWKEILNLLYSITFQEIRIH